MILIDFRENGHLLTTYRRSRCSHKLSYTLLPCNHYPLNNLQRLFLLLNC